MTTNGFREDETDPLEADKRPSTSVPMRICPSASVALLRLTQRLTTTRNELLKVAQQFSELHRDICHGVFCCA